MSDACGQSRALTVLTPVRDEPALRAALAGLPEGGASPFARLPGTHFARCVVLPGARLLVSATHDRGDGYLEQVATHMPDEADEIWGACEGYPGVADRKAFIRYLHDHRVTTSLFVSAYPKAALREVREGLELRRLLGDFAPRAQFMDPGELQAAFSEAGLG